jgi:hypothetical protein
MPPPPVDWQAQYEVLVTAPGAVLNGQSNLVLRIPLRRPTAQVCSGVLLYAIVRQAIGQQVPEGSAPSQERPVMRNFSRLPPLLRVASLLGLLFSLTSLNVLIEVLFTGLSSVPHWSADAIRRLVIALNLGMLGGAWSFVVNTYSIRFRRSEGGPFPLDSWQSQVRAIVVVAALPIGALALAVVIPPTALAWVVVSLITVIAAFVRLAAYVYAMIRRRAMD